MSQAQKALVAALLGIAVLAGLGVYLATRAPEIQYGPMLTSLDGTPRGLEEFRGQPLIVNFWATWCPPCRREIPLLISLQEEYGPDGLTVVGVAVEEPSPVRKLAAELQFNYPILIGEQEAIDLATALGVEFVGLPYTVFINDRGRVHSVHAGELHREDAEKVLKELL